MRALLWKEWRENRWQLAGLLAVLVAGVGLEAWLSSPQPYSANAPMVLLFVATPLVGLWLGATAHSSEFTHKRALFLLASPLSRRAIWRLKAAWGFACLLLAWLLPLTVGLALVPCKTSAPPQVSELQDMLSNNAHMVCGGLAITALAYVAALVVSGAGWPGMVAAFLSGGLVFGLGIAYAQTMYCVVLPWIGPWLPWWGSGDYWLLGMVPGAVALMAAALLLAGARGYAGAPGNDARRRCGRTLITFALCLPVVAAAFLAHGWALSMVPMGQPRGDILDAACSPDGRVITFSTNTSAPEYQRCWWAMVADGSGLRPLVRQANECDWFPELRAHQVCLNVGSGYQWLLTPQGRRLRLPAGRVGGPAILVAPDGSAVAVGDEITHNWGLPTEPRFVGVATEPQFVRLKPGAIIPRLQDIGNGTLLGWSADGQTVYCAVTERNPKGGMVQDIRRVREDGSSSQVALGPGRDTLRMLGPHVLGALRGAPGLPGSAWPSAPIWLLDLDTGRTVGVRRDFVSVTPALSPDGRLLAVPLGSESPRAVAIYEWRTRREVARFAFPWPTPPEPKRGAGYQPSESEKRNHLLWSPDSSLLAVVSTEWSDTAGVGVWDPQGRLVTRSALPKDHDRRAICAGWTSDLGIIFASEDQGRIMRLDALSGRWKQLLQTGGPHPPNVPKRRGSYRF